MKIGGRPGAGAGQLEARLDGRAVAGHLGRLGREGRGPCGWPRATPRRRGRRRPARPGSACEPAPGPCGRRRPRRWPPPGTTSSITAVSFGRGDDEQHEPAHHLDRVPQRHGELRGEQPLERRRVGGEARGEVAGALPVEEGHLLRPPASRRAARGPASRPVHRPGRRGRRGRPPRAPAPPPAPPMRKAAKRMRPMSRSRQRAVDDDADALRIGQRGRRAEQQQGRGAGERPPLHPEEGQEAAGGGEAGGGGHRPRGRLTRGSPGASGRWGSGPTPA